MSILFVVLKISFNLFEKTIQKYYDGFCLTMTFVVFILFMSLNITNIDFIKQKVIEDEWDYAYNLGLLQSLSIHVINKLNL